MKTKYPESTISSMGARLEDTRTLLGLSKAEFAQALGYANQSPLTRIGKKSAFIGPDKLRKLALLETPEGLNPNINWILTGKGQKLCSPIISNEEDLEKAKQLVELFDRKLIYALISVLKDN